MSKSTVFANGQGISSRNSGAVSTAGNDVCKTPIGSAVVPIPYNNTAYSSDIANGTMTVIIDGGMGAIKGCNYSKSTGDEPGTALGVGSGIVGGTAEFINYSSNVFCEGKPVCRNSDPMKHNGGTT